MMAKQAWNAIISRAQSRMEAEIAAIKGVSFVPAQRILSLYDVESYYDATQDSLGLIPYTDSFYISLGTAVARSIFSVQSSQRYKVVVVDCDNTLWKGVVGEDGVDGIAISASHQSFQERLVHLQNSGMIICLCSKNTEQDVLDVFEKRADMRLRLDTPIASARPTAVARSRPCTGTSCSDAAVVISGRRRALGPATTPVAAA